MKGANHIGFANVGPDYDASKDMDNTPTMPHEEQLRISSRYLTAWFNYYLKNDTSMETYLFGSEAQKDKNNGVLSFWEFIKL